MSTPIEIQAQIKRFNAEARADPKLADKLIRGRHYRWFVVDPVTGRIAPALYALWTNATLKSLQKTAKNELRVPAPITSARLDDISRGPLWDRAIRALDRFVPRYSVPTDELNISSVRQRCLFSGDPRDCANLSRFRFPRQSKRRLETLDVALHHEERERHRPQARQLTQRIVERAQAERLECFRNPHLHVVVECADGIYYVFLPRRLTLINLHSVIRDVLAEALEYRFRYEHEGEKFRFVVALSFPVASSNDWVVKMLNSHGILVVAWDLDGFIIQGRRKSALDWIADSNEPHAWRRQVGEDDGMEVDGP